MLGKFFVLAAQHGDFLFEFFNHRVVGVNFIHQFFKILFEQFFFLPHGFQLLAGGFKLDGKFVALVLQGLEFFRKRDKLFLRAAAVVGLQGGHLLFKCLKLGFFGFQQFEGSFFFLRGFVEFYVFRAQRFDFFHLLHARIGNFFQLRFQAVHFLLVFLADGNDTAFEIKRFKTFFGFGQLVAQRQNFFGLFGRFFKCFHFFLLDLFNFPVQRAVNGF